MNKSIIGLTMMLALTGCTPIKTAKAPAQEPVQQEQDQAQGQNEDQIMTCTKGNSSTMFRFNGDEVISYNEVFYRTLEELKIPADTDPAKIQEVLAKSLSDQYGSLAGVQVIPELEADRIKYTLSIDLAQADMDKLAEAGILKAGQLENRYISMETTQAEFEASGYACSVE